MNARILFLALLPVCLAAACVGEDSRWAGTMYDSAGVTIVSNTDIGIWAPGEEWTLDEELRIGAVEEDPHYQFGAIQGITVDSRERILVLDGMAQHIQVYSSEGAFEQTVGARGSGPGELRAGMTLLMGPGDTLLIPDGQLLRFNRYAPDGASLSSFRMVLEDGRPMGFKVTASGMIAEQVRPLAAFMPDPPTPETPTDAIVILGTDGGIADTLLTFPSGEFLGADGFTWYAAEPAWDLTDDSQLVFGSADEYRLGFYTGGQLQRLITKPFERRPVNDRDIDAIIGEMERRWDEGGVAPDFRARMRGRFHFADFFPAFQAVAVGPMGTTWVQRVKPASELSPEEIRVYHENPAEHWDVFDSEGRFLGVVAMPSRFDPMVFRGDKIYGRWRDELDVPYAVRFRVVGDLGGGLN